MRLFSLCITLAILIIISGCTAVTVVVGATSAVVGGVVEVVDVVTPDIIDDDNGEGNVQWMFDSKDIISYLETRFGEY